MENLTGGANRWGRSISNRAVGPFGVWRRGSPHFPLALLLVTSGSLFWIVAVGPENTASRGSCFLTSELAAIDFSLSRIQGSRRRYWICDCQSKALDAPEKNPFDAF